MRIFGCACASGVIALACAAAVFAQPPQTPPGQAKKRVPHQTVDRGDNDAARDLTPEEDADVQRQFGKNESGVVLTVLADGTVAAKLDESYMEALDLLEVREHAGVRIMSPREFLDAVSSPSLR